MSSPFQPKPTREIFPEHHARRLTVALAQAQEAATAGGHPCCGCGWYYFDGRCGHPVKHVPLICGRVDVATFCKGALDRDRFPRRIKVEKYRLDRVCEECQKAGRRLEAGLARQWELRQELVRREVARLGHCQEPARPEPYQESARQETGRQEPVCPEPCQESTRQRPRQELACSEPHQEPRQHPSHRGPFRQESSRQEPSRQEPTYCGPFHRGPPHQLPSRQEADRPEDSRQEYAYRGPFCQEPPRQAISRQVPSCHGPLRQEPSR
jgi:hypothetical protein